MTISSASRAQAPFSQQLEQVKSQSRFFERTVQRYPEVQQEAFLITPWHTEASLAYLSEKVQAATDQLQLQKVLRIFRNQTLARLVFLEFTQRITQVELIEALSDIAEGMIKQSEQWLHEHLCTRYGTPIGEESGAEQRLIVLGMGKLGGRELNFSSDIDLIFAFPEHGKTQNGPVSIANELFFTRLGQALNKVLGELTADGFVFRVDMRLRPFGQTGPLVSSFNALQTYYELHGRAWERYAGLKARALTGKAEDVEFLMNNILNPFIYRRYTDFSAMESLRELKHKIQMDVEKKGREANIKLGVGGIREAEFVVQAFQLVYGGRKRALQTQSWFRALQVIQEKGFMDSDTAGLLREAYTFLRAVENHLQAWDDQQTQILPEDEVVQQALAQSLGLASYEELMVTLNLHRSVVAQQFSEVFRDPETDKTENALNDRALSDYKNQTLQEKVSWLLESLDPKGEIEEAQATVLSELGFNSSIQADIYQKLVQFTQSRAFRAASAESLNRLVKVLPKLLIAAAQQSEPVLTLERVQQVLEAILRRSIYLVLLYENSHAIESLVRLCSASPWLTEQLARHPALFDQLAQAETLDQLSDAETLKEEAMRIYRQASGDEEHFMDQLRIWRHAQVFKVAVADLEGLLPVMQVSDRLTWIAQAVLSACCAFATDWCEARYGKPGGEVAYNPFMVIGYGKLGGIELGYGSDLDIVMLYHGVPSDLLSTGKQALENGLYFLRMGQKVISLLTTPMPSGRLYEVDTRLRPNGASGLMVTDFESYQAYLQNKAWVWEHQAFVRTRPIVAAPENIQAFESFKTAFLTQSRDRAVLCQEISSMLDKMRKSLDRSDELTFDLKYGIGGVVEIEFLVQFWVLAYASEYESLAHYPDNIRLLETVESIGLIESEKTTALMEIYQAYRTCYHRKALQNEKTLVPAMEFEKERQQVHQIWQEVMNCQAY